MWKCANTTEQAESHRRTKTPKPQDLNDYHLVALTSIVIKSLERMVFDCVLSARHDPLQFAYRRGRSTGGAPCVRWLQFTVILMSQNYMSWCISYYKTTYMYFGCWCERWTVESSHGFSPFWLRSQCARANAAMSSPIITSTGAPLGDLFVV